MKKTKAEKGITLIALIITIIVLIILAVVTIRAVQEHGIIGYAKKAVNEYENSAKKEMELLGVKEAGTILEDYWKPTSWSGGTVKAMADGMGGVVPLPNQEKYSYKEGNIQDGLVITDSNDNEWVWVPVSDEQYKEMIVESDTPYTLQDGTSTTTVYSKVYQWTNSQKEIVEATEDVPNVPGNADKIKYAEPEHVHDSSNEVETYLKMLESLRKYHGFYIGRYELGKNESGAAVVQKDKAINSQATWATLYDACKNLNADPSSATTEMIWGCQWDRTCDWLANEADSSGKKYDVNNSAWGNFVYFEENGEYVTTDVAEAREKWGEENYTTYMKYPTIQNTGFSEDWKAKNIYDFAGNVWEWTQQACWNYARVCRRRSGMVFL